MGEIGTPRREYLYDLTFCDMVLIERGYERRYRHMWSAERWSTYHLMAALVGGDKLAEKGVHGPQGLIRFPWDGEYQELTDDEVREIQEDIAAYNRMNGG